MLQPPILSELDPDDVVQDFAQIAAVIREDNSAIDLRPGPFADQLVGLNALLATRARKLTERYLNARSLLALEENPELADPELVDHILSNFLLKRLPGNRARGTIAVVLSDNTTVTIPRNFSFSAEGRIFVTEQVYVAKSDPERILADTDRLIKSTGSANRYEFQIEVVAVEEGTGYNLRRGTSFIPETLFPNFVAAYALNDFFGGKTAETNTDALRRLRQGVGARNPSNILTTQAMLRNDPDFADYLTLTVVGFGSPEMLRDRRGIFPISLGGRVDWYLRAHALPVRENYTITATRIGILPDNGAPLWQLSLDRDLAPAAYEITAIKPTDNNIGQGSLPIVRQTRSFSTINYADPPDIQTTKEAAFSRFQTLIVQFVDNESQQNNEEQRNYNVEILRLHGIAEAQDKYGSLQYRHAAGDLLVKAPVPCFVSVTLKIHKRIYDPDPNPTVVRDAIVAAANSANTTGKFYASKLIVAALSVLPKDYGIADIDMIGRIIPPDGEEIWLRSNSVLEAPDLPEKLVTAKTLQFFLHPESVYISITAEISSYD